MMLIRGLLLQCLSVGQWMGISPKCLYDFADRCAQAGDEVSVRCAVSRGYYAALHAAKSVLHDECEQERGKGDVQGSHNAVIYAYQKYGNQLLPGRTEAKQIARLLRRVKDQRVHADYDLDQNFEAVQWECVRQDVEAIMDMLKIVFHRKSAASK